MATFTTLLTGLNVDAPVALDSRSIKETIVERNAIKPAVRRTGIATYVVETNKVYHLVGGITNNDWVDITADFVEQESGKGLSELDSFTVAGETLTLIDQDGNSFDFTGGGGGFTDLTTGNDLNYRSDATIAEATASSVDPNTIFETDAPTEVVTVLPQQYGGTGMGELSTLVDNLLAATTSAQVLDLLGIDTTGTPGTVTKASVDAVLGVPDADETEYYNGNGAFTNIMQRSPDGRLWILCVTDTGTTEWKLAISPFALLDVNGDPFLDVNGNVLTAVIT